MPFKFIRIVTVTLAVVFVLAGMAGPGPAWASENQHILTQFLFPYLFPDKTALELMQMGKDTIIEKEIEARIKAGEKIEYGQLKVTSQPGDAGVLVSSYVPLGKTPYTNKKLLPGLHRVTVRKHGYYEQVRMVEIKANRQAAMDFKLKPIPYARLTVKVRPPTTKVLIIDVEEPYTPGMKLMPGEYLVSLNHPIYGEQRLYAVLGDNEQLTLNGDMAAWPGKIKIESNPPDATVYLDGREIGLSHPLVRLTSVIPGPHKIQIWKSLFKPATKLVQVESLRTTTVKVDLLPAEHFTNNVDMEFVKIPAGKFMMGFNGSPEFLAERIFAKNGNYMNIGFLAFNSFFPLFPQHLVEITKPFFMQTTEVTKAQWYKVMGTDTPLKHAQLPIINITMQGAKEFIAKLNQLEKGKYRYRLPTEAEWEYAARAGSKGLFYTGDSIDTDQANFAGKPVVMRGWSFGTNRRNLVKVKSFSPNPWGLYDMYGNVSELCADWFDGFYYTYSPIKDPKLEPQHVGYYVNRGGSKSTSWTPCTSGYRHYFLQSDHANGIRLVAEKLSGIL